MTVKELNHQVHKYIGDTADTKPTAATNGTTPGSTFYDRETGIMYITYDGTNWVEKDTIVRLETSPTIDIGDVTLLAGTAVIGKARLVTANGDEITDDTADAVKAKLVDAAGNVIEKAEDAAHSSGDKGIMALGVRSDAATGLSDSDGDYTPPTYDRFNGIRIGKPVFGEPTLHSANNASVNWAEGIVSPLDQKSPSGWLACLYGGVQTGDDWARIDVPVDELLLTKFDPATYKSTWSYWLAGAESMGVGIVIWVHDPADPGKRAEITQVGGASGLGKAAGWNRHILDKTVTQFFFYGENTTGTALVAGTQYTLAQFIADALFSTWTIYRITIEHGWEDSGTLVDAFVADLMLNGIPIVLKPDSSGTGRIAKRAVTASAAIALTLAPKTPWRLLTVDIHCGTVLATGELFTATKDAGIASTYDTIVWSEDLFIGTRLNYFATFGEGYDFDAEDELDFANANTGSDAVGLVVRYQTVFS